MCCSHNAKIWLANATCISMATCCQHSSDLKGFILQWLMFISLPSKRIKRETRSNQSIGSSSHLQWLSRNSASCFSWQSYSQNQIKASVLLTPSSKNKNFSWHLILWNKRKTCIKAGITDLVDFLMSFMDVRSQNFYGLSIFSDNLSILGFLVQETHLSCISL